MLVAGMVLRSSVPASPELGEGGTEARMSHHVRWIGVSALMLLLAASVNAGGWAVVTVVRTPDTVVMGQPATVTYAVRQHGQNLLNDLQGRIVARLGETVIKVAATPLPEKGHYAATVKFPVAGAWTLDIESGFHGSAGKATLRVVEPGVNVSPLSSELRGERLFESKGCARCHLEAWSSAPKIKATGYESGYLARFLTSPPKPTAGEWRMPDLGLTADEVASLVAFINSPKPASKAVAARPAVAAR